MNSVYTGRHLIGRQTTLRVKNGGSDKEQRARDALVQDACGHNVNKQPKSLQDPDIQRTLLKFSQANVDMRYKE